MTNATDGFPRSTLIAGIVLAWFVVGEVAAQSNNIVGYSPSQPSPLEPTGPNVYDPRFDRFTTSFGKPSNPNNEPPLANAPPAPNASQFVLAGFDLSGIGWLSTNPGFSFAMISPQHFITAAHNGETAFVPGASVTFFTGDATTSATLTATVASSTRVASTPGSPFPVTDILLGTLTDDVPSSVTSYPVVAGFRSELNGLPVFLYDQIHRVGTNDVTLFEDNANIGNPSNINNSTNLIGYDFNPTGPAGEMLFVTGDSGKPTFMNLNGQMTLLGSHSAVATDQFGTEYSLDAFLPEYINQMNTLMIPSGHMVRFVPVPEPTLALTAVAVVSCAWAGWRRQRRGFGAGK